MSIVLRPGRPDDAGACGVICYEAFRSISERHGFPPDFPSSEVAIGLMAHVLSRPDVYGVVAERDETVLGSNFLWRDGLVGGVGPITVDPGVQNATVGRLLMQDVLDQAARQGLASVRLVQAAYHGRSLALYAKLGFEVREPLACLQGDPPGLTLTGYPVRRAVPDDTDVCAAICMRVHGHERRGEIEAAIARGEAAVVEHNGRIAGYTTGVGFFGHAVAESTESLKALIGAASGFAGPGLLLPIRNGELFRWCLQHGLRVVQTMTLMSRGIYQEPAGAFLPSVLY